MTESENDWIFDSVLNYIRSPLWKVPVSSFINEHSIVFDSDDENKLEYTKIHNDFKKLIEELLGNLLSEIGLNEEQFGEVCLKADQNPLH